MLLLLLLGQIMFVAAVPTPTTVAPELVLEHNCTDFVSFETCADHPECGWCVDGNHSNCFRGGPDGVQFTDDQPNCCSNWTYFNLTRPTTTFYDCHSEFQCPFGMNFTTSPCKDAACQSSNLDAGFSAECCASIRHHCNVTDDPTCTSETVLHVLQDLCGSPCSTPPSFNDTCFFAGNATDSPCSHPACNISETGFSAECCNYTAEYCAASGDPACTLESVLYVLQKFCQGGSSPCTTPPDFNDTCFFAANTTGSPCNHSACKPTDQGTGLSQECCEVIQLYCNVTDDPACSWPDLLEQCGIHVNSTELPPCDCQVDPACCSCDCQVNPSCCPTSTDQYCGPLETRLFEHLPSIADIGRWPATQFPLDPANITIVFPFLGMLDPQYVCLGDFHRYLPLVPISPKPHVPLFFLRFPVSIFLDLACNVATNVFIFTLLPKCHIETAHGTLHF